MAAAIKEIERSKTEKMKRKEIKERVGAKKKTVGTMSKKIEESCN